MTDDASFDASTAPTASSTTDDPDPTGHAATATPSPAVSPTRSTTGAATPPAPTSSTADDRLARGLGTAPTAVDVLARRDEPVRFAPAWSMLPDPASLAAAIEQAEAVARDGAATADARATAGFAAQLAYRQLAATPAWQEAVLDALEPGLRRTAEGTLAARAALDELRAEGWARRGPPTTLPAWEMVPPAPADELEAHYRDAAEAIGVAWEYLAAINLVETRMGRIRGLSEAGARGPMQFIPESWAIFGEGGDIDDERDAILAAARHLKQRGWDDSPRAALFRYNNSDHYVDAVDAYAQVLVDDPGAYATHHGWQAFYTTPEETFLLPVGYREEQPVPIDEYRRRPAVEVRR